MENSVLVSPDSENPRFQEALALQEIQNEHEASMHQTGIYEKFFKHWSMFLYRGGFQPKVAYWRNVDGSNTNTIAIGIGPIKDPNFLPFRYVKVGNELDGMITPLNNFTFDEAELVFDMVRGIQAAREKLPNLSGDCMSIVGARE